MELRHYTFFVALAEELNFTRAASRLRVAQPALSQQIQRIERELKAPLFVRDKRSVVLTEVGLALLPEAYAVLHQHELAMSAVDEFRGVGAARISAAATPVLYSGLLPAIVTYLRRSSPSLDVSVREAEDLVQFVDLQRMTLDMGLGRLSEPPEGFNLRLIGRERLAIALPRISPLAKLPEVPLAEASEETFLLFPRANSPRTYDACVRACIEAGFDANIQDAPGLGDHSIYGSIACGLGVALVPSLTMRVALPGVVYRPLTSATSVTLPISLIWRQQRLEHIAEMFAAAATRALDKRRERPHSSKGSETWD